MNRRRRIIGKVLLTCIMVWPLAAWIGARLLITQAPLDTADAIVVLGGSATYKERAREAARLLLKGRSQRVLVTNDNMRGPWSNAEYRNPYFYERTLDEIKSAGVPEKNVELLLKPVAGTYEEAQLVRQYAEENKLRSVLIVTSGYHSRRALWVFSRVFRDTGIRVGLIGVASGIKPGTWWLSIEGWRRVPAEYVKMVYYVIKYR